MQAILAFLKLPLTILGRGFRWFTSASAAMQLAAVVALFELLIVLLAAVVVWIEGERAILQAWWTPGKGFVLLGLLLFIPWLAYRAARLWFERQGGRWPDIAAAWDAARAEMVRQQIQLHDVPVFLVLGTDGGDVERGLFADTRVPLLVTQSPAGSGPLHVFANNDGVFLCLSGAGQAAAVSRRMAIPDAGGAGTIAPLPLQERRQATDRLEFFCDLLVTARRPLAPINGIMVIATLPVSRLAEPESIAFGQAVGDDLTVLVRSLGVRAPVTFVAATLQDDPAIGELLSRLTPGDRASAAGVAFPTGLPPTATHLLDLAANVAGPLVDRLVTIVLDPRKMNDQPANRDLVGMLCRQGLIVNQQMARLMTHAFGVEIRGGDPRTSVPLLAGVAVAAASSNPERRAFVRGLIDRVVSLQGELEWTPESLLADVWARRVARVLGVVALTMAALIAGLLWWKLSR